MKVLVIVLAAAFLPAWIGGCSSEEKNTTGVATATRTGDRTVERTGVATATATVVAIDQEKRLVTLKGADGDTFSFTAGDGVRNLAQVKKGDVVKVTYYESLMIEAKTPAEAAPGASVEGGLARAPLGEKPAGVAAKVVTVTATVLGIDLSKGTITLKGPGGDTVTVKAKYPANLKKVKVGDLLEITYSEAVAISVEKP